MAFTVNSLGIVAALVSMPLTGAWHADVRVSPLQGDAGAPLAGSVTLELDGLALTGSVLRSAVDDNLIGARIVGGAGKLGTEIQERYYKGSPQVRRVVEDILRDAGEELDTASSAVVLGRVLDTWQRAREPAGEALTRVAEAFGGSWRVTAAGKVLIVGEETWPIVDAPHILVPGSDPVQGFARVAWTGSTPADVLPGVTFNGQRVHYLVHELTPGGLRSELRFTEPRSLLDRMRAVLDRNAFYVRLWPGVVEKQNADGTVDVVIANRFGLTQVPLRSGVPGLRALVAQGQQVLVGFESENQEQKPFAALWGQSGSAKFGTLAFSKATVSGVTVLTGAPSGTGPQFFEPTDAGELAAQALAATHALLPLTTGTVRVV